jgi:predicted O-methyltransferase YrrM
MEGWLTPERGVEMAEAIFETQPKVVVELGVFGGRSLIAQAMALRESSGGVIYGVDPWRVEAALEGENEANRTWWSKDIDLEAIHRGAMNAVWQHNLDRWAVVIRAASQNVYQLFPKIDMLFIDGNHSEVASTRDVELYLPRVAKGAVVTIDDTDWPTTAHAVSLLDRACDLVKDGGSYRVYQKL